MENRELFLLELYMPFFYGYSLAIDSEGEIKGAVQGELKDMLTKKNESSVIDPADEESMKDMRKVNRFNRALSRYFQQTFPCESPFIDTLHDINTHLEFERMSGEGGKVLDVGCGNGIYSKEIAKRGNIVYAVDIIKRKELFGYDNIIFTIAFSENLPFDDNYFDTILCLFMLEHVADYEKSIKEIVRVSRKYGKIIIGIPYISMKNFRKVASMTLPILNFEHMRAFAPGSISPWCIGLDELENKITNAGASIELIKYISEDNSSDSQLIMYCTKEI